MLTKLLLFPPKNLIIKLRTSTLVYMCNMCKMNEIFKLQTGPKR